jgi:signal transduction histidine kinase
MTMDYLLRNPLPDDAGAAGKICHDAFKAIAERHGFPPDFPDVPSAVGLLDQLLTRSDVYTVIAEADGRVVGSNFLWEGDTVAGVGPITVDPRVQNGAIGRALMHAVLERAHQRGTQRVRLVQAAYHARSIFFALVAPDLRRRWTEEEVGRRIPVAVAHNRLELEDRHARNLEHLSASIAHEIRNPITAAKSLLQQMGEDPHSMENVEYASVALQELERVERSISHLLRYARDEDLRPESVALVDVVQSALEALHERIGRSDVAVRVDANEAGTLVADPEQLRRVVLNLVSNALDAVDGQRTPPPRIDVEAGKNLAGTEVWLRVRDNGPGIEPEKRDEIWTPFRTTKVNGTGLGLPLVRKIVEAHGGVVEIDVPNGPGVEFLVTLPRRALAEAER